MNKEYCNDRDALVASYLSDDPDFAKQVVEKALNAMLEGEMTDLLGVEKGERSTARRGYRSGHYTRQLHMKVGTVKLRVPQDRDGRFSTQVFERCRRSEKALMSILAEMYVQGVSTRKVTKLAESLCGHAFSYGTISKLVATLDDDLQTFATRALDDTCFPYLILDARYEKVREQGAVRTRAVQIAVGIDAAGKRHLLAVELADRETADSWTTLLTGLKERGLQGVEYVVSDSHEGLKRAIKKVLTTALWQRCAVHFLRNAVAHATHQTDPDCVDELKRLWSCSGMKAARRELRNWIERWGADPGCDALVTWVEENIEETFSVYRLPRAHRKRMKSTNMLERYNEEIRRRTRVVRIFPNEASCLRLIRALAAETHDQWVTGKRYLSGAIGLDKDAQKDLKLQEAA